jgi:hypothetical protein
MDLAWVIETGLSSGTRAGTDDANAGGAFGVGDEEESVSCVMIQQHYEDNVNKLFVV